ncbi:MAG: hypothetical protein PF545_02480, partial [Elusimicrobia bacterium]|nr:hypothetical protein [Elusimicrobiota bacterium]
MAVIPNQYHFQAGDDGQTSTFTVTMNTPSAGHDIEVYDINDTAKKGWDSVIVTTKPVSAPTTPTSNIHINSLANIIGSASAYSPAQINKTQVKLECVDGPEVGNFWQDGVGWGVETWLDVTSGTTDWYKSNLDLPVKAVPQAAEFNLWSRSFDNLGSTGAASAVVDFYYDIGDPVSDVTDPDGLYINAAQDLYGGAEEPGHPDAVNSEITNVEITLKYIAVGGTTYYWKHYTTSGTWQATESKLWIDVQAQDGNFGDEDSSDDWYWQYGDAVDWQDQTKHYLYHRAYDAAGNREDFKTKEIVFDEQEGVSNVTLPLGGGQNYSSVNSITGTASDTQGVDFVEINIYNGSDYFNRATWAFDIGVEANSWMTAAGTTSWTFDSSTITFSPGTTYTVKSRMTDKATNEEPTAAKSGNSFDYDTSDPTSYVQYPQEGAYSQVNDSTATFTIYGTANDSLSNVNSLELVIKKGGSANYWNGSSWQGSIVWLGAQLHPSSWTYTGVDCADGTDHRIWIKATDDVLPSANQQTVSDTDIGNGNNFNSKFKYDVTEPVSDITYPVPGAAYNGKIETFTGTFDDPNYGSKVEEVKLLIKRESDGYEWVGEAPFWSATGNKKLADNLYTSTYSWRVSDLGEFYQNDIGQLKEKYLIYTTAKDYAGNYQDGNNWDVLISTFIYDAIAPAVAITTPTHLGHYNSLAEIGGSSTDTFSGVDYVELQISSGNYTWTGSSWTS